jgi:hypothetical protein
VRGVPEREQSGMERPDDRPPRPRDVDALARSFLTYVLLPGWVVPGVLDWYWHRQTKIERTAGAHESLTHVLMAAEGGLGITLGLFLEIDAGVIAAMLGAALAHEATTIWDVAYAAPRRPIKPREQHTHSFLEVLPFVTVAFAAVANPEQARALFGLGPEKPRWRFRPGRPALPLPRMLTILGVCGTLGMLPHVEELVRCLRVKPTLAPLPAPPQPPAP